MAEVKNINGITVIEGDRAFLSALLQTVKEALERGMSITLFNGELKIVVSQSPVNVHNLSLRLREWERLKDNYRALIYFLAKYRGIEKPDFNWERKLFFDEKGLFKIPTAEEIGKLFEVLRIPKACIPAFYCTQLELLWCVQKAEEIPALAITDREISADDFRFAGFCFRNERPYFRFTYRDSALKKDFPSDLIDDLYLYYPLKSCHFKGIVGEYLFLELDGETVVVWKDSGIVFVLPVSGKVSRIGHLFSVLSVYNRSGVLYLLEDWEKETVVKIPYRNDFELFLGLTKPENREEVPVKEIGALLKTVYGTVRDFVERVKGESYEQNKN